MSINFSTKDFKHSVGAMISEEDGSLLLNEICEELFFNYAVYLETLEKLESIKKSDTTYTTEEKKLRNTRSRCSDKWHLCLDMLQSYFLNKTEEEKSYHGWDYFIVWVNINKQELIYKYGYYFTDDGDEEILLREATEEEIKEAKEIIKREMEMKQA